MAIDKTHWLNLSKDGTFKASGAYSSEPADVDALFNHLVQNEISHLSLYFHGGLVGERSGMRTAERLLPVLRDQAGTHPVFVVWESGWFEKIRDNLDRIADEKLFKKLAEVAFKFVVGKLKLPFDGGRGFGIDPAPTALVQEELESGRYFAQYEDEAYRQQLEQVFSYEVQQLTDYAETDGDLRNEVDAILESLGTVDEGLQEIRPPASSDTMSEEALLSGEVLDQMADEEARGIFSAGVLVKALGQVFIQTVRRMLNHTDHGIVCTVAEEILRLLYLDHVGQWLWRQMKEDAQSSFASNVGLSGEALHGGTYFLEGLRRHRSDLPANFRVSLVGHSAGSIYICRLLEKAVQLFDRELGFHRVVFWGPAVDFDLFRNTVVQNADQLAHFRMFALRDAVESSDVLVPVLYPRSLLYLVSGLLESDREVPIVGMQRFFEEQPAYETDRTVQEVRQYIEGQPDRVVWSIAEDAGPGLSSRADGHGAFDGDEVTLESVVHLLRS